MIHMVRDPMEQTLSSYKYDLLSGQGPSPDTKVANLIGQGSTLPGRVRLEAEAMMKDIQRMVDVDREAASELRVMRMDFKTFARSDVAARRTIRFLLDDPPESHVDALVNATSAVVKEYGERQNSVLESTDEGAATVWKEFPIALMEEAEKVWKELKASGDKDVLKVESLRSQLGYGSQ